MTRSDGLEDYQALYNGIKFLRDNDGILLVQLHTAGAELEWDLPKTADELVDAFGRVAADTENKVVILTGVGSAFTGGLPTPQGPVHERVEGPTIPEADWYGYHHPKAVALVRSILALPIPVIAAVNGLTHVHPELALLADIVLASENATFRDTHFARGIPPGDGPFAFIPLMAGINRSRYLLLTCATIDATTALSWGLVAEVLEADALLPRAYELARLIRQQSDPVLRHSRQILVKQLKDAMDEYLDFGLTHEGLGIHGA